MKFNNKKVAEVKTITRYSYIECQNVTNYFLQIMGSAWSVAQIKEDAGMYTATVVRERRWYDIFNGQ